MFGKKPTTKEQVRKSDRVLRGAQRDLNRDRREMERQEAQLKMEIKKMAKEGNKQACATLAKQLVQLRRQQTKSVGLSAHISGVQAQTHTMASTAKMADAMRVTTGTMQQMNKMTDPAKMAKMMQDFERANAQMGMTDEMINEGLDGILEDSGDEAETDAIVSQVLDEIGIEISSKMPAAHSSTLGQTTASKSKNVTDADIEKMLADLK